jgi:hypothetical protein
MKKWDIHSGKPGVVRGAGDSIRRNWRVTGCWPVFLVSLAVVK